MGKLAIVGAVAALVVSPYSAASAADWTGAQIEQLSWLIYGPSLDAAAQYFYQEAAQPPPPYRRIWLRTEWATAQDSDWFTSAGRQPIFSVVFLAEVDCENHRSRMLQVTDYTQNNLSGAVRTLAYPSAAWTYTLPGTFGFGFEALACAHRQPNRRAVQPR